MKKHNDLSQVCNGTQCDASQASKIDSFHTYGNISTVSFIVGGIGVVGGTILLLTQPKESAPAAARVSAYVGPGSAGVTGTFW
jgi:hypothetical protein